MKLFSFLLWCDRANFNVAFYLVKAGYCTWTRYISFLKCCAIKREKSNRPLHDCFLTMSLVIRFLLDRCWIRAIMKTTYTCFWSHNFLGEVKPNMLYMRNYCSYSRLIHGDELSKSCLLAFLFSQTRIRMCAIRIGRESAEFHSQLKKQKEWKANRRGKTKCKNPK
jgi:hypothetical protein